MKLQAFLQTLNVVYALELGYSFLKIFLFFFFYIKVLILRITSAALPGSLAQSNNLCNVGPIFKHSTCTLTFTTCAQGLQ